jgi:methyl-galactoside transport system substrate-binding protein
MIQNDYDIIFAGMIDKIEPKLVEDFVNKARRKSIPLVFYNITPRNLDVIKSYSKAIIINTDSIQAGILQGKMIADAWNIDRKNMDKNGDNIMQYIMLKGESESFASIARSEYSISTINSQGIKTQKLAENAANWDAELAKSIIQSLFPNYGDKIEVVIANNDAMAIGAVKALQKYGYNMGNKAKTIHIFGIGGVPEAQELIKKGFMAGTVLQNPRELADALYAVGMNLVSGNKPLEGTNYKFNETGIIILIPFQEYKAENGKS